VESQKKLLSEPSGTGLIKNTRNSGNSSKNKNDELPSGAIGTE
jgi:hypothetical protein